MFYFTRNSIVILRFSTWNLNLCIRFDRIRNLINKTLKKRRVFAHKMKEEQKINKLSMISVLKGRIWDREHDEKLKDFGFHLIWVLISYEYLLQFYFNTNWTENTFKLYTQKFSQNLCLDIARARCTTYITYKLGQRNYILHQKSGLRVMALNFVYCDKIPLTSTHIHT